VEFPDWKSWSHLLPCGRFCLGQEHDNKLVRYYFNCLLIEDVLKLVNQYSMKVILPVLLLNDYVRQLT
jgi:hypothetical protein